MEAREIDWESRITPEVVDQFQRDGVVFFDQLIHPLWLQLVEMGISRIMNNSSRKQMFFAGEEGAFIDTVRNWDLNSRIPASDLRLADCRHPRPADRFTASVVVV